MAKSPRKNVPDVGMEPGPALRQEDSHPTELPAMSRSFKRNYFRPLLKVLEYLSLTSYVYLQVFASYFGNVLYTILSLKKYDYVPKLSS